jgi:CspA family cold shock protein
MATGTVKWFNPTKGYGFIQPSGGGGRDVFVHISAVERAGLRSLNEGDRGLFPPIALDLVLDGGTGYEIVGHLLPPSAPHVPFTRSQMRD